MADVGIIGFGTTRSLELPDGEQAPVAPAGRARIRYDRASGQAQASFDRGPYEAFGAAGGGGTTVADIAELSALDDTTFADGANVAVASVRDVFELDKASTVAADGITVAVTASGTGRWVRRELASEVWAKQAAWFVDPAGGGNDENDGSTAAAALATWSEYARRVGTLATGAGQTLSFLSDPDEGVYVVRGLHPGGLIVTGPATVVDTGSFTAVQQWDATTTPVQQGQIEDTAQDFTGHEGLLLRVTSGAAAGNTAWILRVGPGGSGTDTVRVSEWFDPFTFDLTAPSPGDDYEIVSLAEVTGRWQFDSDDRGSGYFVELQELTVNGAPGSFLANPITGDGAAVALTRSRIRSVGNSSLSLYEGGQVEFYGSLIDVARFGAVGSDVRFYASAIRDGNCDLRECSAFVLYNNVMQVVAGGQHDQRDQVQLSGSSELTNGGNASARGSSLGVCDLSIGGTAAFSLGPGSHLRRDATGLGRFWTTGQAVNTVGVEIEAYGLCSWEPGSVCADGYDLDVGGSGSEFVVGTTTTDAATLAAAGTIDAATNAAAIRRALS